VRAQLAEFLKVSSIVVLCIQTVFGEFLHLHVTCVIKVMVEILKSQLATQLTI